MAVSAAAVTAKLVALTLSDRNGRTVVFSVIAALVTPVILIATMIMCTLSGTVDHNISAVQLSFHGGYLSSKVPAEYRMYIENMQDSFEKLDGVLNEINGMAEAEEVDPYQVKAIFYALFFGKEYPRMDEGDYRAFADCFVEYEEREDEEGETYTVAIPIQSLNMVYGNLAAELNQEVSLEDKTNVQRIYMLAKYGVSVPGGNGLPPGQAMDLKERSEVVMKTWIDEIRAGTLKSSEIETSMMQLSKRLQNTGGKKVYGYLKRDVKDLVDHIVDELEKDDRVSALYREWGLWQDEIVKTYRKQTEELPPLSKQPKLKSIKNMVIAEALRLGSHHFLFEENEDGYSEPKDDFFIQEPNPVAELTGELDSDYAEEELKQELFPNGRKEKSSSNWWTDGYIQARNYLYGSDSTLQDFEKAYQKFLQEAEQGNGFAMHDLGRMFADGLGRDADVGLAQKWYEKALEAFLVREESVKKKEKPYLQYRIGKMYASGLGAEQNYEKAAHWFSQAAAMDHKYAQYSLAGLYRRGRGVEQNDIRAFSLYMSSAEQGNPYASLELAKMYRDGFGTEPDLQQAEWRFQNAYSGFVVLEEKSHDDKLQYRIGQMLHTGTGTSKDDEGAARYWEKSAKLGNINAQYALGTLWLETGSGDSGQAVEWLTKAANAEHSAAQYVLGKLYQDGVYFNKDMDQAMKWFRSAAELGNEYAAYRMGCLLLLGEEIPKDVEAAVKWLSLSAEKGNPYAQYRLGMLYLKGEEYSPQVEVAMKWLQQAAEQKNEWAFYQLGKLYLSGEHVTKNVETAVHYLGLCAEKGNQYAQYVLGKLYLCGRDVSRDREKAVEYLTASAEQGNLYASFLLEHLDAYQDPSLFLAATRLLHHLEKLFCEEVQRPMEMKRYQIDRKRRRKLLEKKQAQGHHREDQEPAQGIY